MCDLKQIHELYNYNLNINDTVGIHFLEVL